MSQGSTLQAAAQAAGVHPATVSQWFAYPAAAPSASQTQHEIAAFHRRQAQDLLGASYDAIRDILSNPKASFSVRLKAALAMIKQSAAPLPDLAEQPPASDSQRTQDSAQFCTDPEAAPPPASAKAPEVHHPAHPAPYRRVKTGRNELCPCGSGMKFKRCCLGKPASPPPADLSAEPAAAA